MTHVLMPRLSDSMEAGTILTWLKHDGEAVAAGEELVEIETDKATMTYEAEAAGTLRIVAAVGASVAVGEPIASIGDAAPAPAAAAAPAPAAAPAATALAAPAAPALAPPAKAANRVRANASPLARRIAATHGVDLAGGEGSGPRGRITRADVLRASAAAAPETAPAVAAPASVPAVAAPAPAPGETTVQQLSRLQQVVARRMAEAKASAPEFQVQTEVPMDAAIALRAQLKALARDRPAPSLNDLVVKACALALREHPRANGSYRDGTFELHRRVNVGVAVAAEDALVVPTVFDADARSLGAIACEVRRLAAAVREGRILPAELAGGTFTVSNLGMYGVTAMTPILNVPQAGILGVGATRAVLARDADGGIAERQLMTLTLTCDHRILYGADAARFLATIRDLLADPLRLAL
jgi:pyruvate dehydrogenase E2 component (dihydrolipoamide acetyltransferase)